MFSRLSGIVVVVVALVAIIGGFALATLRSGDRLTVVLPSAIGVVEGTPVQVKGFDVGQVVSITARANKAVAELSLGKLPQPLHTGTRVTVEWRSALGERYLQLQPGPASNPVLPDGAMIQSGPRQVVAEDLIQALDAPTRAHLSSFLQQLNTNLTGHQVDLNRTLQAAGPSVQALGAVLNAAGTDNTAIKTVLATLRQVTEVLADRRGGISSTVQDLNQLTSTAAIHEQQLRDGLVQLPSTLDAAKHTLDKVPAVADATAPLLNDLRPAADRLPRIAANLSPVMRDLRPSVTLLGPTLQAAERLLGKTPDFLDAASDTLPQLRTAVERAGPAVAFLRPYTPEIMGFFSDWGNIFASYDAQGHFVRPLVVEGPTAVGNSPNVATPGLKASSTMAPGEIVNQPWTDANGSGPR
jgi:phospholipid/cholesterol/gamma-HCH transport system substrate-binding protein